MCCYGLYSTIAAIFLLLSALDQLQKYILSVWGDSACFANNSQAPIYLYIELVWFIGSNTFFVRQSLLMCPRNRNKHKAAIIVCCQCLLFWKLLCVLFRFVSILTNMALCYLLEVANQTKSSNRQTKICGTITGLLHFLTLLLTGVYWWGKISSNSLH